MWKKATGNGTGLRGVFAPLVGKTISCTTDAYGSGATATVDSLGDLYVRAKWYGATSAWVPTGPATYLFVTGRADTTGVYATDANLGTTCFTSWPQI